MPTFRTRPDPTEQALVTVVGCGGVRYHAPDVATIDRHLDGLRDRIARATPHAPIMVTRYREDADRLLERRFYLQLTTGER